VAMLPFNPAGSVHAYFAQSAGCHVIPCWNWMGDNNFGSMAVWPIVRTVKSGPNDAFNDTMLPMSIFGDADVVDAPMAPFAVHPPMSATPTTLAKASSILGKRTRAMYRIQRP
jgi:hypothetical protein